MPVRIRLQRQGKKGQPFYHIVVADGRAPRDGKFIEKLGTYNPMTNPATITVDVDKAVKWMRNGAQPSDTAKTLLSHKGAMLKHHLLKGVDKGALTLEQAETKFQTWIAEKETKNNAAALENKNEARNVAKKRLEAETKVNEAKAKAVEAKKVAAEKAASKSVAEEISTEEVAVEETTTAEDAPTVEETPAVEEAPVTEEPATEVATEETPTAEEAPATEEEKPVE
ncbi:MAG: 30S ribosomal protein S16 [Bacteroidales bacterium]|nr:30S ribosomal protein S16 [Bacteroidales bacterium]